MATPHEATIVVAVAENGVIGLGGTMPWHCPQDLRFFKRTTMGGVLIMGRTTAQGIGRTLPGRRTIVLSTKPGYAFDGADVASSLEQAYDMAGTCREVFVVGGAKVYEQALAHAGRMIMSLIPGSPEGDTWFPDVPERFTATHTETRAGFAVRYYRAN